MKFSSFALVGLAALSSMAFAEDKSKSSEQHPFLVRLRALNLRSENKSAAFTALGTAFGANSISVERKTFPEVDLTYFFNKNWAAELVLTYPQEHKITLAGVGGIGTVTHLPPILSAQYHLPIQGSKFTPYVGVGVNFTIFTSTALSVTGTQLEISKSSFGLAWGFGLDYKIDERWSLNFDYKKVNLRTNVKAGGTVLTNLKVNPDLISFGIGYRF